MTDKPDVTSRRSVLGAAAVAALLSGAALAWWRSGADVSASGAAVGASGDSDAASATKLGDSGAAPKLADSGAAPKLADAGAALAQLWALELPTPTGQTLKLSTLNGRPLLLNFWATWCPPCVEELPLIDRFYQENAAKGWQVLGLAVDQVNPVNAFLRKAPVKFQVAMAGLAGIEISKMLGNISGGLPFTVVIGAQGAVLHRKIGSISPADLTAWAALK